jgi:hypothetical protein
MSDFDKQQGFSCAVCSSTVGGKQEDMDFHESIEESKRRGWISRKDIHGDWYKFCCQHCYDVWKPLHT